MLCHARVINECGYIISEYPQRQQKKVARDVRKESAIVVTLDLSSFAYRKYVVSILNVSTTMITAT